MNQYCSICSCETEHNYSHTVERNYYENKDIRDDRDAYSCTGCGTIRLIDED